MNPKSALTVLLLLLGFSSTGYGQLADPNEAGITYGHMHLNVPDVEAHRALWVEHFGGVSVDKGPLRTVRLENTVIIFNEAEPSAGARETVMDHFGVKVRSIENFLAKWRAAELEVGREFIGAEGQSNAYVMMPGGVYVELQEDQQLSREISGYHIHFITQNAPELLDWYTEFLGTEIRPRGSIGTTTNVPGMNLSFGEAQQARKPSRGTSYDHIGFEVDNLEQFCEQLIQRGYTLDVAYRDIPAIGLKIAFLTDPHGTYIELTEGLHDY